LGATSLWPIVCALLLTLPEDAGAQDGATPLTAADLVWPRLPMEADSAEVLRVFGVPDARDIWFTSSSGEHAPRWRYPRYNVYFDVSADWVIALELTRRGLKTRRGVQVRDSVTRVRTLYGDPLNTEAGVPPSEALGTWRYDGPTGVITITVQYGRVHSIVIGSSLTNE
jgi:hypothetical protein